MSPKVELCLEQYGMDIDEFLDSSEAQDSVVYGACSKPDCDYTVEVEPDCRNGYCEECGSQSVRSILVYLGVI